MEPIADHPSGVTIRVLVVPGASRSEVTGRHGDAIRIRVTAPPERGKANRAVCDLLETACGGRAEVVRGATSRTKTILLRDVDRNHVETVLRG